MQYFFNQIGLSNHCWSLYAKDCSNKIEKKKIIKNNIIFNNPHMIYYKKGFSRNESSRNTYLLEINILFLQ